MDEYTNFAELEQNQSEGQDYAILYRGADSKIAIMAPHGGGIEPGTMDIADAVAAGDYAFYAFKGIKKAGNRILHITSSRYDEPIGLRICRNARVVITIHGCRDKKEIVFIGGKYQKLKQEILHAFRRSGFRAVISELSGFRGVSSGNICNRCGRGEGVQLEISRGLREKMFDDLDRRSFRKKTNVFYEFVHTLKEVLLFY